MIKLKSLLLEAIQFTNWKIPSVQSLKREFEVEHEKKGHDFFNSEKEFLNAVKNGNILTITPDIDNNIEYRSNTADKAELLNLIRGYNSYPKYRNETTLDAIYDAYENNKPMDLPIVIEFKDGTRRIFSGNTRLDAAFHIKIKPKVLLIKSNV